VRAYLAAGVGSGRAIRITTSGRRLKPVDSMHSEVSRSNDTFSRDQPGACATALSESESSVLS